VPLLLLLHLPIVLTVWFQGQIMGGILSCAICGNNATVVLVPTAVHSDFHVSPSPL